MIFFFTFDKPFHKLKLLGMKKIRIIYQDDSDNIESLRSKKGFSEYIGQIKLTSMEIDAEALAKDLATVYQTLAAALNELKDLNSDIEINLIKFTLSVDSSGQVALLSAFSGSSTTRTGITFELKFK